MESIKEAVEYFHKGGLVMWPLLLCSIIVVTIAIERYLYYKTADSGSLFTQEFCTLISKGDVVGAEQLASASAGECARIIVRLWFCLATVQGTLPIWNLKLGLL